MCACITMPPPPSPPLAPARPPRLPIAPPFRRTRQPPRIRRRRNDWPPLPNMCGRSSSSLVAPRGPRGGAQPPLAATRPPLAPVASLNPTRPTNSTQQQSSRQGVPAAPGVLIPSPGRPPPLKCRGGGAFTRPTPRCIHPWAPAHAAAPAGPPAACAAAPARPHPIPLPYFSDL
ncbi:MAG: hypothetical protein J3K34DRAFT_404203 [Monoraphidium minutum]|nr:MAG: hypothetical protein J3K34DRAFT_404203 [Monoraphidium minutum]